MKIWREHAKLWYCSSFFSATTITLTGKWSCWSSKILQGIYLGHSSKMHCLFCLTLSVLTQENRKQLSFQILRLRLDWCKHLQRNVGLLQLSKSLKELNTYSFWSRDFTVRENFSVEAASTLKQWVKGMKLKMFKMLSIKAEAESGWLHYLGVLWDWSVYLTSFFWTDIPHPFFITLFWSWFNFVS